jgi:tetratricopeptide (TPR) repeat protein
MSDQQALIERAETLINEHQFAAAEQLLNQVLSSGVRSLRAAELMGRVGTSTGQFELAAKAFALALSIDPANILSKLGFAAALNQLGKADQAEVVVREAIATPGAPAASHYTLSNSLRMQGKLAEARASAQAGLEGGADQAQGWTCMSVIEEQAGDHVGAQTCLEQAVAASPGQAQLWDRLARTQYFNGQLKASEESCRRAIELQPRMASAHRHLSLVKDCTGMDDPDLAAAKALADSSELDYWSEIEINFALGRMHDQIGEWQLAYEHTHQANQSHHQRYRFDLAQYRKENDQIIAANSSATSVRSPGARPLFIVGLPRSGTTLLEQMLARHPMIDSAGELVVMEQWAAIHRGKQSGMGPDQVRSRYLTALGGDPDCRYVIDKLPQNFRNLDAIAALFPEAGVIALDRAALDVCRSNYFTYYRTGNYWANRVEDLTGYQQEFRRLMANWRDTPPLPMLEMDYQELVADPRAGLTGILEFLVLEWHDDCLYPESAGRSVNTASAAQVRQPVHQRAVGRSAPYSKYFPGIDS